MYSFSKPLELVNEDPFDNKNKQIYRKNLK